MSSVRASLRQRYDSGDDIGAVISDVNRHISMDVGDSGQFMTLFYLAIDSDRKTIQWVRAGHDPGMLYRRAEGYHRRSGRCRSGTGCRSRMVLQRPDEDGLQAGDIILLGTDGIWEAFNRDEVMFGKEAVKQILREKRDHSAGVILNSVFEAVASHAGETKIADDMTLIVVKIVAKINIDCHRQRMGERLLTWVARHKHPAIVSHNRKIHNRVRRLWRKSVWDDSFNIQVDVIDEQHRRLVDLMNRLIAVQEEETSDEEIADILGAMTNYLGIISTRKNS